jgi:multimeric flavodoxin WrbA
VVVNCTLKPSPQVSATEALGGVVAAALRGRGVRVDELRAVDYDIKPGVTSDEGEGDQWPALLERILTAQILVVATPTWLGQPSSVAKRVLERMDALVSETDDDGRPVADNRVGGVVVTGNEDGAHHRSTTSWSRPSTSSSAWASRMRSRSATSRSTSVWRRPATSSAAWSSSR